MELIDTQWDVNKGTLETFVGIMPELIDTQWDVNKAPTISAELLTAELIDTQWDVNKLFINFILDKYMN